MVADLDRLCRKPMNHGVREEQNLSETEECVQTRKQLANATLDNAHMYKRSGTDFADEYDVMSCEARMGRTKR
jgi:hypothetical protein